MIDYGHGVSLDAIERRDLEQLRTWRNDKRIWQWCRQNDLISEPAQERWFERISNDPTTRMYTITRSLELEGGRPRIEVLGVCGLTSLDWNNRRAEFSIYIQPDCQARGLGRQALKTLLTHGFRNLGLHLIWGETFFGNRALAFFQKLGFRVDGVRREFYFKDGRFLDATLVSITRAEWEAKCLQPDSSAAF